MLRGSVLLEGDPPSQSQISGRLKQVCLKIFSVFSAIHHSFNFLIMDLMVLRGMFKVSDIYLEPNPDLYFSTTLSLTYLESSLVFMVPLAWWCPLLSGVADSGLFQNRCIYSALRKYSAPLNFATFCHISGFKHKDIKLYFL